FNHKGDLLASTDWDGILRLWDFPTGHLLLDAHPPMIFYLAEFSADDRLLAAAHQGDRFQILRVASGAELRRIARVPSPHRAAHAYFQAPLDGEGKLLGLGLGLGVAIVDLHRREEVAFFPSSQTQSLCPLRFTPDGSLMTAGDGGLL